jgi:transcriptional regulator with XRE-family HTH domain
MFSFGQHLKSLRLSKKCTQKQLAFDIGISESIIQRYESNTRKPTYDTLILLSDYFDISIDYLVGRTDIPEINKSG